ncbi:hypothetical protein R3P38DRAFT_2900605 [Favolaschia claudopus]|uniref:Serine-rich protein n=1 Tax=Favolaschia claudopus TaxID=2862362 RepID=A0AAW0CKH0_9AGAR
MENVLARFRRGRTKSLSGTAALNPASSTQQSLPQPQPPPLERRIHPDLDSLVANWAPAVTPVSSHPDPATANASSTPFPPSSFPTGLPPSTRRHSVDGAIPVLRAQHHDTNLEGLPEVSVPLELPLPTRARRLITRLTGSTTPPSSSNNASTSSAAAGCSRPHLTDFGETGRGSPAFSQGTFSRSASQSRSPSRPSTNPDESVTYSHSGHDHPITPASEVPSPSSGFTFGSRRHGSASASPVPPLPSLDHPAFREHGRGVHSASQSRTPSQAQLPQLFRSEPRPRSSSSLPSMSTSKRKRTADNGDRAKARDVFASLRRRPGSARRRASTESSSDKVLAPSLFPGPEASGGGGMKALQRNDTASSNLQARDNGGLRDDTDNDVKFDARAKRVALGGSSDTQVEGPVWLDIPAIHSTESSSSTMDHKKTSPLIMPPTLSIISATPEPSPAEMQAASDRQAPVLRPPTSSRSHSDFSTRGKRKADAVEGAGTNTPPKSMKTTAPPLNPSHPSSSSHAPSSFHRQKRAKVAESPSPRAMSRAGSASAPNTPSASSHRSASQQQSRSLSRAQSQMSQASLPISALVTPNAPSVTRSRMGASYYMQDPRRPPRIQPTRWGLTFGDGGSPVHAWLFFVGFVLFPLWWVGGLCVPIPRTRRLGGDAEEKGREQVILDDPQMESDARSWRKRCRIMSGISLVTYVPFIVLLAVFLSRR